jgi:hypothetical protein
MTSQQKQKTKTSRANGDGYSVLSVCHSPKIYHSVCALTSEVEGMVNLNRWIKDKVKVHRSKNATNQQ